MRKEWKSELWDKDTGLDGLQNLETTFAFEQYWHREDPPPNLQLDSYNLNLCENPAKDTTYGRCFAR